MPGVENLSIRLDVPGADNLDEYVKYHELRTLTSIRREVPGADSLDELEVP